MKNIYGEWPNMMPEKEQILFDKYPEIFKQRHLSIQQSCMPWGICCGDGWYDIIDNLCRHIQEYVDKNGIDQVEAVQVKEKFGGLRFYVSKAPKEIYNYIYQAEEESLKTCENCGSKKDVSQTKGWIVTLCKKCMEKKNAKR